MSTLDVTLAFVLGFSISVVSSMVLHLCGVRGHELSRPRQWNYPPTPRSPKAICDDVGRPLTKPRKPPPRGPAHGCCVCSIEVDALRAEIHRLRTELANAQGYR